MRYITVGLAVICIAVSVICILLAIGWLFLKVPIIPGIGIVLYVAWQIGKHVADRVDNYFYNL